MKRITVRELEHMYATGSRVHDGVMTSASRYEIQYPYMVDTSLINSKRAMIISRRKKIVLINSTYTPYSTLYLRSAFSDEWTVIRLDDINIGYLSELSKSKQGEYLVDALVKMYFNEVGIAINIIQGFGRRVYHGDLNYNQVWFIGIYNDICEHYKLSNRYLNKKHIGVSVPYTVNAGWTTNTDLISVDYTINELLDDNFFKPRDKYIIDRANWIHKYLGQSYTKAEKEAIYDCVDTREAVIHKHEVARAAEEMRELVKKEEDARTLAKDVKGLRTAWLSNEHIPNNKHYGWLHKVPIMLRFRAKDTEIETSRSAIVPTTHAKLLYRKMKQCKANNEAFSPGTDSPFRVGHYTLRSIAPTFDANNNPAEYVIQVGCHRITESAIKEFIKLNKLDW